MEEESVIRVIRSIYSIPSWKAKRIDKQNAGTKEKKYALCAIFRTSQKKRVRARRTTTSKKKGGQETRKQGEKEKMKKKKKKKERATIKPSNTDSHAR